ncbi:MAG: LysR substrate-binding domain-containing protein, partial [Pseudomonadota bacterium]
FYQRRRAPRLFDRLIEHAQSRHLTANIAAEAESFFAAVAMAQAGLGIALLPKPLLRLQQDLVARPLPPDASLVLETACAVHSSTEHDRLIQAATDHFART